MKQIKERILNLELELGEALSERDAAIYRIKNLYENLVELDRLVLDMERQAEEEVDKDKEW